VLASVALFWLPRFFIAVWGLATFRLYSFWLPQNSCCQYGATLTIVLRFAAWLLGGPLWAGNGKITIARTIGSPP